VTGYTRLCFVLFLLVGSLFSLFCTSLALSLAHFDSAQCPFPCSFEQENFHRTEQLPAEKLMRFFLSSFLQHRFSQSQFCTDFLGFLKIKNTQAFGSCFVFCLCLFISFSFFQGTKFKKTKNEKPKQHIFVDSLVSLTKEKPKNKANNKCRA
jgi:hypothetical protein